jgi:uncharacterized metal-binding protein YceD (DUF177 family)
MANLHVNLNELPPGGKDVEGELRQDIFKLESGDGIPHMAAPVRYALHVDLDKDKVIISGRLETAFTLHCVRCLEAFEYAVLLDPYENVEPREGRTILDLTEWIREDILLALPGYPHCEESAAAPRLCPAQDRFASDSAFRPLSEEHSESAPASDIWHALDGISGIPKATPPNFKP